MKQKVRNMSTEKKTATPILDALRGEKSNDPNNNSPYPDKVFHQLQEHQATIKASASWLILHTNPVIPMHAVADSLKEAYEACTPNHPKYLVDWLRDVSEALEKFSDEWREKKLAAFCAAVERGETEGRVVQL
jgi:hypothetical protein